MLDKEIDEGDGEVEEKRVYGKRAKAAAAAYLHRGSLVMLHNVKEMYGKLWATLCTEQRATCEEEPGCARACVVHV